MVTTAPEERTLPLSREILIIEDHHDGREMLRLVLEIWGHHVEVAADGEEGLRKALALRPEIALVDIGLPRLDGYQVAQRLRKELGDRVFLIACTAYGSLEDQRRALEAGFDLHLRKPVDLDLLAHWLGSTSNRLEGAAPRTPA
jgi:CheY-like chemotaxis protein